MAQENLTGRSVSNYRLLERIGEGGTATVYRAEHPERGVCAVKILKQRLRNDPTAVQRFLREAEFGTRVEHSAVIQTYEYGEDEELYFLALEWANGEPLAEFVQRTRRIAPELAAHITAQLAGGLVVAHKADIVHRDLKPENIIYDPETKVVKLLDFGIARDAQADPAQRLTRTGFFVGTLQYVAPEALSGELVGPAADIYSLATITYYALTGRHPFDGRSPRELFQQLLTTDPTPLNQAEKGLKFSDQLEAAVMHGLAREPDKRPATAEDYANAVEDAVAERGGQPVKGGLMDVFKGLIGRKG